MAQPSNAQRRLRGAVIVTGNEVLSGRVTDKNGPWISQRLGELGLETAGIVQVGDRREDMLQALAQAAAWGVDLIVTTGGLGPTADDLTIEIVAQHAGRPLQLDTELEARVWNRVKGIRERFPDIDLDALHETTRKQALQPQGATPLEPVGTAPGSIVPPADGTPGPLVVVLPGPPSELRPMWLAGVSVEPLRSLLAQAPPFEERMLRLVGLVESDLAAMLRETEAGGVELDRMEITTCMRSGEIEIVTRFDPSDAATYAQLHLAVQERWGTRLYSDDRSSVEEIVAWQLAAHGWTVGLAESCTGGLVAARLIRPPGASAYVRGGVVAYTNEVKVAALGVPQALLDAHGAVSSEVAQAMAEGVVERLGADVGLAVTGVAGPSGGSEEKPVGTVWFGVVVPGAEPRTRKLWIPGNRDAVRERSVTAALHLLRGQLQRV